MSRIQDSFTRPNASLIGITSDAWSWVNISGSTSGFQVNDNKLVRNADQSSVVVYANKAFGTNNQFFEFKSFGNFAVGSASAYAIIRMNSDVAATSGYYVRYNPRTGTTSGQIIIGKSGGDTVTAVTTNISQIATDVFTLRGESTRVGNTQVVKAYVNGTLVGQLTDTTATLHSGKYFAMQAYANSARKNENGWSWEADDLLAGDQAATSRFNMSQYNGTAEVPVTFEMIKEGTTQYGLSYVDYVVGEPDAIYPNKYNAGYYNS